MASSNDGPQKGGAFGLKNVIVIGVLVILAALAWRGQSGKGSADDGGGSTADPTAQHPSQPQQTTQGRPSMQPDPYPGFYAAYEMPAELVEGEIALTAWGGAAEKYRSGDYEGAAVAFTEVLAAGGEMPVELVQFFLGQSHLAAGAAEPAATAFRFVLEGENASLAVEASWYLALSCVRTGDVATAKEQLDSLVSSKGYKADVAKMLLAQMGV
ncbi:MAG: hypothetical protein QF903_10825 [Planctomycetota bacterium]|nr:hypothetical protein [Planctomycetota bacterium]MDP6764272.1 hypothetical protein [Planctomycetota bacterium]MDP6989962.1 hypothetical protein [Planctomycetota bacterium]